MAEVAATLTGNLSAILIVIGIPTLVVVVVVVVVGTTVRKNVIHTDGTIGIGATAVARRRREADGIPLTTGDEGAIQEVLLEALALPEVLVTTRDQPLL